MTLNQFFAKQSSHWNEIAGNIPVLRDLDYSYDDDLSVFATVRSDNLKFAQENSIFLSSMDFDDDAKDINAEIAENIAHHSDMNLVVKILRTNGDYDIVSWRILQGISRDDNLTQLLNPNALVIICDEPKTVKTYRKPVPPPNPPRNYANCDGCVSKWNTKSDWKAMANTEELDKNIQSYIGEVGEKFKELKKKGGSYSFSYSFQQDGDGKAIVKYNLGDGEIVSRTFEPKTAKADEKADESDKKADEPKSPLSNALQRFKNIIG